MAGLNFGEQVTGVPATPSTSKGIELSSNGLIHPSALGNGGVSTNPKPKLKPKSFTSPPAPTQVFNSPDPYVGIPDSTEAQWINQEADQLESLGAKCMKDLQVASQREKQGLPVMTQQSWIICQDFEISGPASLRASGFPLHGFPNAMRDMAFKLASKPQALPVAP